MEALLFTKIHPDAQAPYRKMGSAGYDIYSPYFCRVSPNEQISLNIGIIIEFPDHGTYARVAMRSSWAKKGLIINAGVIDADYRGPIICLIYNSTDHIIEINTGDAVCQLILESIYRLPVKEVTNEMLTQTDRGTSGFGE